MASSFKALVSSSKGKEVPNCALNYFDFLQKASPQRVMFYLHGEWRDFPEDVTASLIKAFKENNSSIEFDVGDNSFTVDFLNMVVINLNTEALQSIAWIDKSNKCFFPEYFLDGDTETSETDYLDTQLNLTLKIMEIKGNKIPILPSHVNLAELERDSKHYHAVEKSFVSGMGAFLTPKHAVAIHHYMPNDSSGMAFSTIFHKEMENTRMCRRNPNIQHVWVGMSREGIMEIVRNRFHLRRNLSNEVMTYGIGVYCSPNRFSYMSASNCEVDANGLQHMLLCQVILGNMEKIKPGTNQFLPSSDYFDTGVDDYDNPKVHVIWSSRVICQLHPQYIVSFKLPVMVREYFAKLNNQSSNSGAPPLET